MFLIIFLIIEFLKKNLFIYFYQLFFCQLYPYFPPTSF